MSFIGESFNDNGNIKPLNDLKEEFHFKDTNKMYWLQIIDALLKTWEDIILNDEGNATDLFIFDHYIVINSEICSLNKLNSKELSLILVDRNTVKMTAHDFSENLF